MKDEFAVVLLDVSMPGMDGFETASLIHEHPRFETTPIIFVTGVHVTELDRLKGYKLGAVDYVYIPVVPEILRSKVAVLVELHLQRRELQTLNRSLGRPTRARAANTTLQAEKTRELERLNQHLKRANAELEQTEPRAAERSGRARARRSGAEGGRPAQGRVPRRCSRTSCAIRSRRSATPWRSCAAARSTDPQLAWSRDVIERQVKHLTRLVDDLLDVSRITRGNINLSREPLPVGHDRGARHRDHSAAHHRAAARADGRDVRGAAGSRGRSHAPHAGARQPAQQRREVHRPGWTHRAQRCGARARMSRFACATTASAFRRSCCRGCSSCSRRWTAAAHRAQGGLGIGLALVRQLVADARRQRHRVQRRARARAASSSSGCRCAVRSARRRRPSANGTTLPCRRREARPPHPARRRQSRRARQPRDAAPVRRARSAHRRATAPKRSSWPPSASRTWCCSTSACRSSMATKSRAASAQSPGARTPC